MEIWMNGLKWTVEKMPAFHKELNEDDGTYEYGFCDPLTGRIVIRDEMSTKQTERALIHELTHAVIESYRLATPRDEEETAKMFEGFAEKIVAWKDVVMDKWEVR